MDWKVSMESAKFKLKEKKQKQNSITTICDFLERFNE